MKANEFVKKFGWDTVKDLIKRGVNQTHVTNDSRMMIDAERYIRECPWFADDVNEMASLVELKLLVEAHELVESYGGIYEASCYVFTHEGHDCYYNKDLEKAISLVESCQ